MNKIDRQFLASLTLQIIGAVLISSDKTILTGIGAVVIILATFILFFGFDL